MAQRFCKKQPAQQNSLYPGFGALSGREEALLWMVLPLWQLMCDIEAGIDKREGNKQEMGLFLQSWDH